MALEIDKQAYEYLLDKQVVLPHQLQLGDCLQMNWQGFFKRNYAVVGNFPYNISSQIIFKVLENRDKIAFLVGMFQEEVARRITTTYGNKQYGIQSVLVQTYFETEYNIPVPPEAFSPVPRVNSGIITLKRIHENDHIDYDRLLKLSKVMFAQRRKTVKNNLKQAGYDYSNLPQEVLSKRAEQLPKQVFWELLKIV